MTALFTVNGIGYNTNEKGNRFYKIENEKATRIGKAEYEAAFEEFTGYAADDEELEFDEDAAIREAKKEMEEASDRIAEDAVNYPKKSSRSLRKAAHRVTVDGAEIGLTEKHVMFLENLPKCSYWDHGLDSSVWVFDVRDTLAMAGMAGMTVGAMISTLREKGLLVVGEETFTNFVRGGRGRKEKYMELTETGKKVAEALGIE
jgi:hypothetical protein